MSHSKKRKKDKSLWLDKFNRKANKFVINCALCGTKGFNPSILKPGFDKTLAHQAIKNEVTAIYKPLILNENSLCETCASIENSPVLKIK